MLTIDEKAQLSEETFHIKRSQGGLLSMSELCRCITVVNGGNQASRLCCGVVQMWQSHF